MKWAEHIVGEKAFTMSTKVLAMETIKGLPEDNTWREIEARIRPLPKSTQAAKNSSLAREPPSPAKANF